MVIFNGYVKLPEGMCNPKKILSIPRGMEVNISQKFFLSIMDQHICCDIHGDVVYPAKLRFFVFKLMYMYKNGDDG